MQFSVIFLFLNLGVFAEKQYKRIILDSDTGGQTEISKLRNEVASLRTALSTEVSSLLANMSSELARQLNEMNSKVTRMQDEMNNENARLQNEMNTEIARLQNGMNSEVVHLQNELSSRASTYIRWGKESCNTNGTTLIYKGYMAGKGYDDKGSGTNSLCLPGNPIWGKYNDTNQVGRGFIYGAEFQEKSSAFFGKHVRDEDIPCAVCKVPGTSVMIPARVNCYPGWKMEYTGYLMSANRHYYSANYVCVDGDPDFVSSGAADTNGHVLYLVEGICGTLFCPPYVNNRELACVVCSM